MGGWLRYLSDWLRLPVGSALAELDKQIDKFRILRDSYQIPSQAAKESMDLCETKSKNQ